MQIKIHSKAGPGIKISLFSFYVSFWAAHLQRTAYWWQGRVKSCAWSHFVAGQQKFLLFVFRVRNMWSSSSSSHHIMHARKTPVKNKAKNVYQIGQEFGSLDNNRPKQEEWRRNCTERRKNFLIYVHVCVLGCWSNDVCVSSHVKNDAMKNGRNIFVLAGKMIIVWCMYGEKMGKNSFFIYIFSQLCSNWVDM